MNNRSGHAAIVVAFAVLLAGCDTLEPKYGYLNQPGTGGDSAAGGGGAGGVAVDFGRDIRPLMNRSDTDPTGHGCKKCHYDSEGTHIGIELGGLHLETLGQLRQGGTTSGTKVVIAGDPDDSVIVQKLEGTYSFGERMPRDGPVYWSKQEISLMRSWIQQGAKGADDE